MKAKNESEALEHMSRQFKRYGRLSGLTESWTRAKVTALDTMMRHCQTVHGRPIESVVDVGIGDMEVMYSWRPWENGDIAYLGVEGCKDVYDRARKELHGGDDGTDLVLMPFSSLVHSSGLPLTPDAVLLLDVLYHIPDVDLSDALVEWAMGTPAEYIVLSHATDPSQTFDSAQGPGDPGYAWFPHPFEVPRGWDVVHQEDSRGTPQRQRVVVLARNSVED